jgi:NAD+ synthase
MQNTFSKDVLEIDCAAEVDRIVAVLTTAARAFKRRGAVLGLSGGIDSSVCAALCVRAFGAKAVTGLLMPENESSSDTLPLSQLIAEHLQIKTELEDISGLLEAAGCYARRDACIRQVIPEYTVGWKSKITLPSVVDDASYRIFSVVAHSPLGLVIKKRLTPEAYLGLVAASNFKQRTRKMLEYYYADKLNYLVIGTPNKLEYDLGFFVKNGDGEADVKPIAHLYKTQVYALARYLGIPNVISERPPTTDTYSLPQGQDEFYFSLPYDKMDLCLYARDQSIGSHVVGCELGLSAEQVERVYRDIDAKRRMATYLHLAPVTVGNEQMQEVATPGMRWGHA